jgi:hypothetical protein
LAGATEYVGSADLLGVGGRLTRWCPVEIRLEQGFGSAAAQQHRKRGEQCMAYPAH